MSFNHGLKRGDILNNNQLMNIFKCSNSGGMRRSLRTNSLILISDHTKAIYEDRWINGIFHYTGMGLENDQSLDFAQNKTLAMSTQNNIEIYLFEVFKSKEYTYMGQVKLADKPYQEEQPDINGNMRKVWIFPLTYLDGEITVLPENTILEKQRKKEKEAKRLSDTELMKRARQSKKGVGIRNISSTTYERNAYVSEYAKRRANGICQLCEKLAPFNNKNGEPYLETHHIKWLSKGGLDTIENTVALCPNCHRKMHVLDLEEDKEKLMAACRGEV